MGLGESNTVQQRVDDLISQNNVMVFSKSYCPYSKIAKKAFQDLRVEFKVLELDKDEDGEKIQGIMKEKTGASSVPRVFIKGKFIGGGTETENLYKAGTLGQMVNG